MRLKAKEDDIYKLMDQRDTSVSAWKAFRLFQAYLQTGH